MTSILNTSIITNDGKPAESKTVSLVCDAVGLIRFPLDKFIGIHKENDDQWGYRKKLVLLIDENGSVGKIDIDRTNTSYFNELCSYVARKISEGATFIDITDPRKCISEM